MDNKKRKTFSSDSFNDRKRKSKWDKNVYFIVPCINPLCDHREKSKNVRKFPNHLYNNEKGYKLTLDDLIELGKCYHCKEQIKFKSMYLFKLCKLVPSLTKLKNMVGLDNIKKRLVKNIIKFLMNVDSDKFELLHTIIGGPPGVGKTTFVHILADIYLKLEILSKGHVVEAKASDLIGKYVGHTAIETETKIEEAVGGILLIDEFYTLGGKNNGGFSKECIDTLNRNMTERSDWILIGVGYMDQIISNVLDKNKGMESRFKFYFTIDPYTELELKEIFKRHVKELNWNLDISEKNLDNFFTKNYSKFQSYGRDIQKLLDYSVDEYANRIVFDTTIAHRVLTLYDVEEGLKTMEENKIIEKPVEDKLNNFMYL